MAYPIQFLREDGNFAIPGASTGTGTVTSVALAMPADFTVTGSPVSTVGTFTVGRINQAAHFVLAGPTTGSAAPAFRALVATDIPPVTAVWG